MDGTLSLRSLERTFGTTPVLRDLSFDVPPGLIFGFLGPNGSGKTTTMRAIFGLTRLDGGEVLFNGHKVDRQDRLSFGYMPEERGLYRKMTASAQLRYLGQLHGLTASEADRRASYWFDRLGLVDHSNKKIEALSLGNQQRVQLVAALIHDPQLLVLDEPFSGLDPVATASMAEVMRELVTQGRTLLFSSHQLDLVESICDSVAIINDGRLVAQGSVFELTVADGLDLTITFSEPTDDAWLDGLAGVVGFNRTGESVHIRLVSKDEANGVVLAAMAAARISEFRLDRLKLSQVFLKAVGSDPHISGTVGVAL